MVKVKKEKDEEKEKEEAVEERDKEMERVAAKFYPVSTIDFKTIENTQKMNEYINKTASKVL